MEKSAMEIRAMTRTVIATFDPFIWSDKLTPFEVLISTVLSQKTERRGTLRAFMALKKGLGVSPKALAEAHEGEIAEQIKSAGLYRSKSVKIKAIALAVLDLYEGDLGTVLELPEEEARQKLMALPGVGPKTADVVLAFVAKRPILAVDVHIFRIAERWHATRKGAGYEEVRRILENAVPPDERTDAHLALIEFGREICTARRPKCEICPVNEACPSAFKV